MKKECFANAIIYFICIAAAGILNLAVMWGMVKIVDVFIEMNYLSIAVTKAMVSFITVPTITGAVLYYEAYKKAGFDVELTIMSLGMAEIARLFLATILKFYPFAATGTRYLAGIMSFGNGFVNDTLVPEIKLWMYIAAFLIYALFNIGVAVICGVIGATKRKKIRKELLSPEK